MLFLEAKKHRGFPFSLEPMLAQFSIFLFLALVFASGRAERLDDIIQRHWDKFQRSPLAGMISCYSVALFPVLDVVRCEFQDFVEATSHISLVN